MKQVAFFISFLCICLHCYGQTSDKKNQDKFEHYLKLGYKYNDARKLDSVNYFLEKADSLVINFLKDSTSFYKKKVLKASLLIRENKPHESVQKLLKALSYFKDQKDSTNIGNCFYTLSIANYYLNRLSSTKQYSHQALLYKNHLSKKIVTRIYQNLGSVDLEEGINKNDSLILSAIKSYGKAIEIYKTENWITEQALATSLLAECYHQLNDFKTAFKIIDEAILLSKKDKNKSQEGFALIKKANFLANKKQFNKALETIKIAKYIFKTLDDKPSYLYAIRIEKIILIGLKRYKEATVVGDEIFNTSVTNYNSKFSDKVAEMDAKYKTAENEKKIFQQKEELLAKELVLKNRNLYAIIITAALLILGIIFLGIFKKNQFKRRQLRKEMDLKDALTIIKTQNKLQEQRLRISRDLHDNIGSQLTFIISSIDNLKYISKEVSGKLKEKLINISAFTSVTIHELRDTIWAMNKSEISVEDVHARILSFVEKAKIAVPTIAFEINDTIDENISFSSLVGMNIFRVTQEAINNAIKYADASKITISLAKNNESFEVSITDNGKGFDLNTIELGNGLSNMEKRMSEIGGTVNIQSKINEGTQIKIICNL